MDSEATINLAIERKVGNVPYSLWNIGVTDNPTHSKQLHANEGENTIFWKIWPWYTKFVCPVAIAMVFVSSL